MRIVITDHEVFSSTHNRIELDARRAYKVVGRGWAELAALRKRVTELETFPQAVHKVAEAFMRVYTLWHEGDDGEIPWIIDAVDQYTIDLNGEFPPPYLKHRADIHVREMIIDIPEVAVRELFSAPRVRGTVIKDDQKAGTPHLDVPDALLPTACEFGNGSGSGNGKLTGDDPLDAALARELENRVGDRGSDVAAAAYRRAAAKLREWRDKAHAKGLESATEHPTATDDAHE